MRKSYMSGAEYRETLAALGLSLQRGARALHVDRKTSERRALEQLAIGWDTATLLRLMKALKLTPERLAKIVPEAYKATHGSESDTVGSVSRRKARG